MKALEWNTIIHCDVFFPARSSCPQQALSPFLGLYTPFNGTVGSSRSRFLRLLPLAPFSVSSIPKDASVREKQWRKMARVARLLFSSQVCVASCMKFEPVQTQISQSLSARPSPKQDRAGPRPAHRGEKIKHSSYLPSIYLKPLVALLTLCILSSSSAFVLVVCVLFVQLQPPKSVQAQKIENLEKKTAPSAL